MTMLMCPCVNEYCTVLRVYVWSAFAPEYVRWVPEGLFAMCERRRVYFFRSTGRVNSINIVDFLWNVLRPPPQPASGLIHHLMRTTDCRCRF